MKIRFAMHSVSALALAWATPASAQDQDPGPEASHIVEEASVMSIAAPVPTQASARVEALLAQMTLEGKLEN